MGSVGPTRNILRLAGSGDCSKFAHRHIDDMGSPGGFAPRLLVTPPEKGSFPLDHFGLCINEVKAYQKCLQEHDNNNSGCHELAKQYLQCRMDHNLMAREDLNSLGFAKPLVPVTEEERASYRDSIHIRDPSKEYVPGLGRIRRMSHNH